MAVCLLALVGTTVAAPGTTRSSIAWANVAAQLEHAEAGAQTDELERLRWRLLADDHALTYLEQRADAAAPDSRALLARARNRAALHRFQEALIDLDAAARGGAGGPALDSARMAIRIAIGEAAAVVPLLGPWSRSRPDVASWTLKAQACAALGQWPAADRWYRRALAALPGVSPFPAAELAFARGVLWSEYAGDPVRGRRHYLQALARVPEFVAARVHLAELEAAAGRVPAALALLAPIVRADGEPEALALRGRLRLQSGDPGGRADLARARSRFEALLRRQPLAFADHAARFFLDPQAGADPERAWRLARRNYGNRPTAAAAALLSAAAIATRRTAPRRGPAITGLRCDR